MLAIMWQVEAPYKIFFFLFVYDSDIYSYIFFTDVKLKHGCKTGWPAIQ